MATLIVPQGRTWYRGVLKQIVNTILGCCAHRVVAHGDAPVYIRANLRRGKGGHQVEGRRHGATQETDCNTRTKKGQEKKGTHALAELPTNPAQDTREHKQRAIVKDL
jgi:hypothetical protein